MAQNRGSSGLGRSWRRTALIRLLGAGSAMDRYAELAAGRRRNTGLTLCTGCSGEPYTTLATLLAYSLVRHENPLPTLRVVYDGAPPVHLRRLGFVDLEPVRYDPGQWPQRALEFWNFVGKPQAMLGAATPLAAWVDCDVLLLRPISPLLTGNAFIPTDDRVGGGLYCLDAQTRPAFYREVLAAQDELGGRSDRPCMQRAIDRLQLGYQPLPDSDRHYQGGPGGAEPLHWMHLARGKARRWRYVLAWWWEVRRLLNPPREVRETSGMLP